MYLYFYTHSVPHRSTHYQNDHSIIDAKNET